jgi:hypothetical protein
MVTLEKTFSPVHQKEWMDKSNPEDPELTGLLKSSKY